MRVRTQVQSEDTYRHNKARADRGLSEDEHAFDHRALWEALLYLNGKVQQLEEEIFQGGEE